MARPIPHPSIYDNISAAEAPVGEQSNLVNPVSQTAALIAVNSIALLLMYPTLVDRFWVQGRMLKPMGWDDCKARLCDMGFR